MEILEEGVAFPQCDSAVENQARQVEMTEGWFIHLV